LSTFNQLLKVSGCIVEHVIEHQHSTTDVNGERHPVRAGDNGVEETHSIRVVPLRGTDRDRTSDDWYRVVTRLDA
jgi:hypothetical protein